MMEAGGPGRLPRVAQPKEVGRGRLVIVEAGPAPGESYLRLTKNSLSLRVIGMAE